MKKIVTVLGARPQFIKAAVLSRILQEKGELTEVIVHTGQHFDDNMSEVFFQELGIPAASYNLDVNQMGHGAMTGQMMERLEPILEKENPDLVVVYGDTNSTLAGALVASKMGIPVAHVEAGLRSGNMEMPEEINRILTDRISTLLFCPTEQAVKNLKAEGFESFENRIIQSGDIMKDSVAFFREGIESIAKIKKRYGIKGDKFLVSTIHRQENTEDADKLASIFEGLDSISKMTPVIMPLHPRTKKAMEKFGIQTDIKLIDPLGYVAMQQLLHYCQLVITDSGGLQKEAYFHKKPSIIVRRQTEWVELIAGGLAKLTRPTKEELVDSFRKMESSDPDFNKNFYGTQIGETVYKEILRFLEP